MSFRQQPRENSSSDAATANQPSGDAAASSSASSSQPPSAYWRHYGIEVKRKAADAGAPADARAAVERASGEGGVPVDAATRGRFEAATGADLGGVRIHTGAASAEAAAALRAQAYTVGHDVHFGAGQYRPGTGDGDRLIAHELAHTVQQGPAGGAPQGKLEVSQPHDAAETEADAVAEAVVARSPWSGGFQATPPSQMMAPSVSIARRAWSGAARLIMRKDLDTNGGTFKLDPYQEINASPGKDIGQQLSGTVGITFTPKETVLSDKITFTQVIKPMGLFANEKGRATQAKDGEAGWTVDRADQRKYPSYGTNNDGKATGPASSGGTSVFGWRKSKTDFKAAWMSDTPRESRSVGQAGSFTADTFALDNTHGKWLGAVRWGFAIDASGNTTKLAPTVQSMGDPGGLDRRAMELWNQQADDPDTSKRNHPDQQKLPLP